MSEPVKIAEDLQEMFEASKLDTTILVGSQIRYLIERVSAAEAALALAKGNSVQKYASGNGTNGEPTPAQDYWVHKSDYEALKAENARLKAPVSDEEINAFTKVIAVPSWARSAFFDCLNDIIAARSKAPDGAQKAEGARDE